MKSKKYFRSPREKRHTTYTGPKQNKTKITGKFLSETMKARKIRAYSDIFKFLKENKIINSLFYPQ